MNYVRVKYICWIYGFIILLGLLVLLQLTFKRFGSSQSLETTDHAQKMKNVDSDLTSPLLTLQNTINLMVKEYQLRSARSKTTKVQKGFKRDYKLPYCGDVKPFLLIEVHSSPESFTAREAIRVTWGQETNDINRMDLEKRLTWKTVFLVGKSQNETVNDLMVVESQRYQDIVIGDFLDTYRNLTYKTLLTLEWPVKYCRYAKYIMKTDEDCYINVMPVINLLAQYQRKTNPLYLGSIHWKNKPSRRKSSKFYVSSKEYRGIVYPPYAAGGGYVFTASLAPKLLHASESKPAFPMEDAYFGLLMQHIGVKPTHQPLFLPYTFGRCELKKNDKVTYEMWYDDSLCNIAVAMVIHDVRPHEKITMHINVMTVHSVPSVCNHEKERSSWKTDNCYFHHQ
ncbi:beta-1,3-galactosyltransferase 5 [Exaiptasia diaphana]|uniref:Hexosyltransferase n=1 Tax=Exaiptasia diaphana TaxID=2652724 RepID=A0A913Y5A8_EXADI|nr:beta-1,3-galactosyltransferase 5 [Exaiptasia diaphana]